MSMRGHSIRAAADSDVDAIAAVWHEGWADGHLGNVPDQLVEHRRFEDLRSLASKRVADTHVIEGDGVLGFVVIKGDEVEQIYVARHARGEGVAGALLDWAEESISRRHSVAWLAVVSGNTRARRFYERQGWRDAGGFDYHAEVEGGTLAVPCRRYEKTVSIN